MTVLGWDVGGAHLKAARVEGGRVTAALEVACPLWQGLDHLDHAFAEAGAALGYAPLNAVTMTGELCDIFSTRAEGVERLATRIKGVVPGAVAIYAGAMGWLGPEDAALHPASVASANWHATASLTARTHAEALFVDMGSTTTDIIPIAGGRVAARGVDDATRLLAGELVYAGATRGFLMATAQRVPFRGAWTPLMNEYFGAMADAYRVLGWLPDGADLHATADGRDKSAAASAARLARMIGRDAGEGDDAEWRALAAYFAEAQLRALHDGAAQVLSAVTLPDDAPIVAAGAGRFVVEGLAARLGRTCVPWETLVPADHAIGGAVSDCAPAVSVALLVKS